MDPALSSDRLSAVELGAVRDEFNLGPVLGVTFLTAGLMNENWRVTTDSGRYALKRIRDVSADLARRNLRVMAQLAEREYPICRPVVTATGDPVLQVSDDAYCVVPWVSGEQPRGLELSLEQAEALGDGLGGLHVGLNSLSGPDLPVATVRPNARVADPPQATSEADRFLLHISREKLDAPFDRLAATFWRNGSSSSRRTSIFVPPAMFRPGLLGGHMATFSTST